MKDMYTTTNPVYIKSNMAIVMRLLSFLSVILLVVVLGLCSYIIFTYNSQKNFHYDQTKQFYFTIEDGTATVSKFLDPSATTCDIPAKVNLSGNTYDVTTIGVNAFTNHRCLQRVNLPDSITKIVGDVENQKGAFSGCTVLTTIDLGKGLNHIGAYAFKNCLALASIKIPVNVQFVQEGAFENCLALETVQINGNGTLKPGCFKNCLHVETLQLAAEVALNDYTKQALMDLTDLQHFTIFGDDSIYQLNENGSCLLTTTENLNDTMVLGGSGAIVPASVTKVLNWAWGKRAKDNFYVPATVQEIGEFAFTNQSICTDAPTKPVKWLTTVPVYTNAQLIKFVTPYVTKEAYIYDVNGETVYPVYEDLFFEVESETPFKQWGVIADAQCEAVYQDNTKGSQSKIDQFNTTLAKSAEYIENTEIRLRAKMNFWEKFKSVYYLATAIDDPKQVYDFDLDEISAELKKFNDQIDDVINHDAKSDDFFISNNEWEAGLQDLVDTIDQLEIKDLSDSNDLEKINKVEELLIEAKSILAGQDGYKTDSGRVSIWQSLRNTCEDLLVDIDTDSLLGSLIADCESLDYTQYNNDSWINLQTCLVAARKITQHNLSISVVRQNLANARDNLCEVVSTDVTMLLNVWISICNDLLTEDYQDEEYDRLLIDCAIIQGKDSLTNTETANAIQTLRADYGNLVSVKQDLEIEMGVFNLRTIPFFILGAIIFTLAVVCSAIAMAMKHQLRQNRE